MLRQTNVILYCIPTMEGGGTERQLVYLTEEIVRHGWSVHVALLKTGVNFETLNQVGAKVHKLTHKSNYDPRIIISLISLIKEIHPHIIQTWLTNMDVFGGLASTLTRIPFVISERCSKAAYPPTLRNRLREGIGKYLSYGIIANSEDGVAYWRTILPSQKPIAFIPNIAPISAIQQSRPIQPEKLQADDTREVILFAGRFSEQKNLDFLMPVLDQVVRRRPRSIAVLCGNGDSFQYWQSWISEHGLNERIRLTGYVDDLPTRLHRAAVFVFPSKFEGQPNVVLEAMAARCPLVVSDIPAHRAILNDDEARIIALTDAKGFVEAIITTLDNREAARARAEKAFARIQNFTREKLAQDYIRFYEELVAGALG